MTDPFNDSPPDVDNYVKCGDLGQGRLVLVYAKTQATDPRGANGPYVYVNADVVPLDGPLVPGKIDQVGPKAPAVEIRFSGERVSKALQIMLRDRPDGKPAAPILARMDGRPSQRGNNTVWSFGPFREEDREPGRAGHANYIASTDPFS